ncbi:MAG: hypothetical protein FD145_530 [Candidatus Saganbacteria bacterium]|uniref:Translocation and assembly module TamB C-terminal domain-containing protein n=1 Tax=Candidatus Saganbacteria bacterium TaxID=2575572 RepID=A0A833L1H2_UNCSA|nr:MAG: hypothetical protein FD145_530 [Candidatus Saganbacteria bacterium]
MKKIAILLFLLILSNSAFCGIADPIYENIKQQAINSFSDIFSQKVEIARAGGRIVGKIDLLDCKIGKDIFAEKITINYNPVKYLMNKGDIVPSITRIDIIKGRVKIIKNRKQDLNVLHFLKPPKPGESGVPFKAKLKLISCMITYIDEAGLPYNLKKEPVIFGLQKVNGKVDLSPVPNIKIDIEAAQDGRKMFFSGTVNSASGKYNLKVSGKEVLSAPILSYFVPNLNPKKGWANIIADITNENINIQASGIVDDMAISASGKVFNGLDLKLNLENIKLEEAKSFLPELKTADIKGIGKLGINISGPYDDIKFNAAADIKNAQLFQQNISGRVSFNYGRGKLVFESKDLNAYGGKVLLSGNVDLANNAPIFNISASLQGIDLARVLSEAPIAAGKFSGQAKIFGNAKQFAGNLNGRFLNASILGQEVENGEAKITFDDGTTKIETVKLFSPQAEFAGSGEVSSDLNFNLYANARGVKLKGENELGKMQAKIDKFQGNISFKVDEDFIETPLKRLNAKGLVEISEAIFGEQNIDRAYGGVDLAGGLMEIKNAKFLRNDSTISVSGKVGEETNINCSGRAVKLEDLSVLGIFLPAEFKPFYGIADMDINVGGRINALTVNGKFGLRDGNFNGIYLKSASAEVFVENNRFNVKSFKIKTVNSNLEGRYLTNKAMLDAEFKGNIYLEDFAPALKKYGIIAGFGKIALKGSGQIFSPIGKASISFRDFRFNNIFLDYAEGEIESKNQRAYFSRPLTILSGKNIIKLKGGIKLDQDFEESVAALDLNVEKAEVSSFTDLLLAGYSEVSKYFKPAIEGKIKIDIDGTKLLPPAFNNLLYDENAKQYYLKYYEEISAEAGKKEKITQEMEKIKGEFSGKAAIYGKIANPSLSIEAEVKKGSYGKYNFDSLSLKSSYLNEALLVKSLILKKSDGKAEAFGEISTNGKMNFKLFAKSMPLDFLKVFSDKKYEGLLDMGAKVEGSLKTPAVSANFKANRGGIAGIKFDNFAGQFFFDADGLALKNIIFSNKRDISSIEGTIDAEGSGNIKASLSGEAIGLFNIFTDEVVWKSGKAQGRVSLSFDKWKPRLLGYLAVTDANLYIKRLDSEIYSSYLYCTADGNSAIIENLTAYWYGKASRYLTNTIKLKGQIEFNEGKIEAELSDTHLFIDMPNLYQGEMDLRGFNFAGDEAGYKIKGNLDFNDGMLFLPKAGADGSKSTPVDFDIVFNFNKNVYLASGDVLTLDLSGILLNLEMTGKDIRLFGLIDKPNLSGKVVFKRGTVNIMGREFSLLSEDTQKKYFTYENAAENTALFNGTGVMPDLKLLASANVDEKTIDNKNKKVVVVSSISGVPFAKEENKKLTVNFEAFDEENGKYSRAKYSEQEVRLLLLPDFIKSLAGMDKEKGVNTNAVMADYLNSRLQAVIFRGLERGIEKALGLESLVLEYNFGSDIKQALGVDNRQLAKPAIGVGFVKGFFDKLYIDVRYSQGIEQGTNQSLNYQISYKLTSVISVDYYREPVNFNDLNSGQYKTTLKAGYSF